LSKLKLIIDSSQGLKCRVELEDGDKQIWSEEDRSHFGSQVMLSLIQNGLEKNNLSFSDLKEIEVKTSGPSFTGVRVGVAIANALAWSLKIPVNGLPVGKLAKANLDQILIKK